MTIQEEGIKSYDFSAGSRGGAIGATYVYPSASSSGTIGRSAMRRHHDLLMTACECVHDRRQLGQLVVPEQRSLAQSEFFEICGLDLDATTETLRAGLSSTS
jgi:hypothetical protein